MYSQDNLKSKKYHRLTYSAYNLETQGFSLMEKFVPSISQSLFDQLKSAYSMTFKTFGQFENVNTTEFRRGIQYYTKILFGYYHDDYDYIKINLIFLRKEYDDDENLEAKKSAKSFIKKLSTDPKSITKLDYDKMTNIFDFFSNELFHIIILVEDTKFEVSMAYFTYALDQYLKPKCDKG